MPVRVVVIVLYDDQDDVLIRTRAFATVVMPTSRFSRALSSSSNPELPVQVSVNLDLSSALISLVSLAPSTRSINPIAYASFFELLGTLKLKVYPP